MLTKQEIKDILKLLEPGEVIPLNAFLAARLQSPTQEDIEWVKSLEKGKDV